MRKKEARKKSKQLKRKDKEEKKGKQGLMVLYMVLGLKKKTFRKCNFGKFNVKFGNKGSDTTSDWKFPVFGNYFLIQHRLFQDNYC